MRHRLTSHAAVRRRLTSHAAVRRSFTSQAAMRRRLTSHMAMPRSLTSCAAMHRSLTSHTVLRRRLTSQMVRQSHITTRNHAARLTSHAAFPRDRSCGHTSQTTTLRKLMHTRPRGSHSLTALVQHDPCFTIIAIVSVGCGWQCAARQLSPHHCGGVLAAASSPTRRGLVGFF